MTRRIALAVVSALVFSTCAYGWATFNNLDSGMEKSGALDGENGSSNGDTNILIMGLDSRLDENGNPLPQDVYNQLHAGDQQDGGYNSNVIMLLHVPHDGSKATSISVPRDDEVDLPGCPDGQCRGKIKQAYGLAFDQKAKQLIARGVTDKTQREQQARDAGRKSEIDAVRQLLGGVPVDHFVEVTLMSFFQIAQVVQPITVCVNEDTQDDYSGAHFHPGQQQINAAQAVSFVRQRRDVVHPQLDFTDLDRERRQQAFIASLAYQLKQGGVLADPSKLQGIMNVAKQNMAVDSGLNLLQFASQATNLTNGNITFTTLPIDHFGKDSSGEDVNIVNVAAIRTMVRQLLGPGAVPDNPPAPESPSSTDQPGKATVDVVNANGKPGLAEQVERALTNHGYTAGTATNSRRQTRTVVYYGASGSGVASQLAKQLGGVPTEHDPSIAPGHLKVELGTDFSPRSILALAAPDGLATANFESTTPAAFTGNSATNPAPGGANGANPDTSNALSGGGIPCVK